MLFSPVLLLAVACSDNPAEPDPPPTNAFIELVVDIPDSYAWDAPPQKRFSASHPDGFSDGFVEFYMNDELVWSIDAAGRSSVDTTWTQSFDLEGTPMDFTADLEAKYNLVDAFERVDDRNSVSGSESIAVTRSPNTEALVYVKDFFTNQPVTGTLTLLGNRTVPVQEGKVELTRFEAVNKDSLEAGLYRMLLEAPGYVTHSSVLTPTSQGELTDIIVLPEEATDWSYDMYLDHLYSQDGNIMSQRWADGSVVDVLLFDEGYISSCVDVTGWCFFSSSDANLVVSQNYLANSEEAYGRLDELIPTITLRITRQSESDVSFPERYRDQEDAIYIAGSDIAPFDIAQSHTADESGVLRYAFAMQRTDPPATNVPVAAALMDGLENMSLSTTGQEPLTVDPNTAEVTPFGVRALQVLFSTPPRSGLYNNVSLDRADGSRTSVVRDYRP